MKHNSEEKRPVSFLGDGSLFFAAASFAARKPAAIGKPAMIKRANKSPQFYTAVFRYLPIPDRDL